jgi:hypothetical protein
MEGEGDSMEMKIEILYHHTRYIVNEKEKRRRKKEDREKEKRERE